MVLWPQSMNILLTGGRVGTDTGCAINRCRRGEITVECEERTPHIQHSRKHNSSAAVHEIKGLTVTIGWFDMIGWGFGLVSGQVGSRHPRIYTAPLPLSLNFQRWRTTSSTPPLHRNQPAQTLVSRNKLQLVRDVCDEYKQRFYGKNAYTDPRPRCALLWNVLLVLYWSTTCWLRR